MHRRGFLRLLATILGLSALGSFLYPLFRFLSPLEALGIAKKVTLPQKELPVGAFKDLLIGGTPSIVIHSRLHGYIALSRVCTHLGCLVNFDKDKQIFICPCHGGEYDLEGNVIKGPPPKPLPRFAVKVEDSNLLIG
jgi:cytochrome b6-f complex iron-sulfur subunit